jgi:hypothetical protein
MKRFCFVFTAAITALFLTFGGAISSVHAQVTRPFSSGFQVQNLSSAEATADITFYESDGSVAHEVNGVTIPGNENTTFAVLPDAVPQGFSGSAVISSSEQVAAIVNLVSPDIGLSFGGEAYIGFDSGARSVSLPLLFKNASGFNTFFNVQNVGDAPASVSVTYSGGGLTNPVTEGPVTIQPNAAQRFDQNANSQLPDNFVGSATIESDQDIVAAVVQVGETTVLAYNGFTQTSTEPVFPLVNTNNGGFITGISLQNVGDTATEVTVSYTPSAAGAACTETKTIGPDGATELFALLAFLQDDGSENCANGETFVGSARVTTNSESQPLVAIVNQLNNGTNKGGAYASFNPANASDTVVFPLIQDDISGFFTGLSMVNVGSTATTVTCTYSPGSTTQTSETLQPGDTFTPVQLNEISSGFNGSGVCTASPSSSIIGIANQVRVTGTVDTFFVYEGLNN